jgi:hypothetical protein
MGKRIGTLMAAFVAALLALLVGPLPGSVAAVVTPTTGNYAYDGAHHSGQSAGSVSERSPPWSIEARTTYDAVDRWSHGDSARPDRPATAATYQYDDTAQPAQFAHRGRSEERPRTAPGESGVIQRSEVAPNRAAASNAARMAPMGWNVGGDINTITKSGNSPPAQGTPNRTRKGPPNA